MRYLKNTFTNHNTLHPMFIVLYKEDIQVQHTKETHLKSTIQKYDT